MIDLATGMRPGERYRIENTERVHPFPGFFLDGKYYLGPELLTAVGWLEGTRFIYDALDPTGEPVFPNRAAGNIENLVLTLVDGTRLEVSRLKQWPPEDAEPVAGDSAQGSGDADAGLAPETDAGQAGGRQRTPAVSRLWVAGALVLVGASVVLACLRGRR
ncbi:short chain dehydrogenase [Pseudomonas sp. SWRI51]|nr:short chain dehydrogenase [Pseudomonas sp. SWRI51]